MDDLLNHAQQLASQPSTPITQPIEGRVAYVVNQGYGTGNNNTQQLAEALNQHGLETLCMMVRPGWPWGDEREESRQIITPETNVNGVRYLYSQLPESSFVSEEAKLEATVGRLMILLQVYRPMAVLVEASVLGLATWVAAERLGLELYGIEEGSNERQENSNIILQAFLAKKSNKFFVSDAYMKDILVENGVEDNNIALLGKTGVISRAFQGCIIKKYISKEFLSFYESSFNFDSLVINDKEVRKEKKGGDYIFSFGIKPGFLFSEFILSSSESFLENKAVFGVRFFDSNGFDVSMEDVKEFGYSWSKAYGNYKYLNVVSEGVAYKLGIKVPESAISCVVKIGRKKGVNVELVKDPRFEIYDQCLNIDLLDEFVSVAKVEKFNHVESFFKECNISYLSCISMMRYLKSLPLINFFSAEAFRYFWSVTNDPHFYELARQRYVFQGRMYDVKVLVEEFRSVYNNKVDKRITRRLDDEIELLENGFSFPKKKSSPVYESVNNVLYLLHNRLPYNSGGYATRTHGLLTGVEKLGVYKMHGVSRPGYPSDHTMHISQPLPSPIPSVDIVDGIEYLALSQSIRRSSLTMSEYVEAYAKEVEKVAKDKKACVIHAAANFPNGLAANLAAKRLGIKSVYEVRGLWEITRLSRQEGWDKTDQFHFMAKMEAEACKSADAVITITEALKDLMVERGVDSSKITVAPNCVHTELFSPLEKDQNLAQKLGIQDEDIVIGYIGSIVNYEGLDNLLEALALLVNDGVKNFKFLLVGDGAVLDELKQQVLDLELQEYVIITGRVPHEEVQRYYSLVDITPFPRKPYLVCEAVSPLKPFEAMASQKAVIVSSCAALTEIIEDGYNGVVFEKGNVLSFKDKLKNLIVDDELRKLLSINGRNWVVSERDWTTSSEKLKNVYDSLLVNIKEKK